MDTEETKNETSKRCTSIPYTQLRNARGLNEIDRVSAHGIHSLCVVCVLCGSGG